jgi:pyruvate/2-oxoglutarate/acetoin dehydrogenase E1 component/TPP-dependent pyruvate/acetoin dehydrogenase alpha subunit
MRMPENENESASQFDTVELSFEDFRKIVIDDYRIGYESRQASLIGRREVLSGKAKFGIFGDGKEVAQLAMAKVFKSGDWRAGYYRDQTFMLATGMTTLEKFFSQLYANPDLEKEPSSGGRQMNCHFATRSINEDGSWKNQTEMKNSSSDISSTGTQMARLVGLAYASKLYRQNPDLHGETNFSINGNEVAFGTIGNASTSEGVFLEAVNAAGVLEIPLAISIWDDGYGISVPNKYQTTKEDISEVLKGFQRVEGTNGFEIFKVKGWDYPGLCETYEQAIQYCRKEHVPVMIHVTEMTQPQGHSSSGSHERYKSKDRLQWEAEHDCLQQMREWMIASAIATEQEIDSVEEKARIYVRECQKKAWNDSVVHIKAELHEAAQLIEKLGAAAPQAGLDNILRDLRTTIDPGRKEIMVAIRKSLLATASIKRVPEREKILSWHGKHMELNRERYNSTLFSESAHAVANIEVIPPAYEEQAKIVDGREVLNACFDANFERDKRLVAFGEDVGAIGDVNQGFANLQAKYGLLRIVDTGIREMTILGQGIGLALRGLRPIAEIQYIDYVVFGLNILTDDLASLSYRTKGGQKAPLIIRTRGHRLEGIWHSGSPMTMLLGSLQGIHICVPRNMTQAAGMYNTLLRSDEPAMVVECLNGYRLKEMLPSNPGEFTVPLGQAEVVRTGADMTIVSYGSTLRIVQEAADELEKIGINVEIVDPQTLSPFDQTHECARSLQKTNKLLVVDEDIPGGATAYMLQKILEEQKGYYYLDAQPRTITAKPHRPPYGSDGDYFSKPSVEDVVEMVYSMMSETNPGKFPPVFE